MSYPGHNKTGCGIVSQSLVPRPAGMRRLVKVALISWETQFHSLE